MRHSKIITILLLLCITQQVSAIGGGGAPHEDITHRKGFLRLDIIERFVLDYLGYLRTLYGNHFLELVEINPKATNAAIMNITGYFIYILEFLYIAALLVIGVYLLFLAGSPVGRLTAKSILPGIIAGMALTPISPHIMGILLNISGGLTHEIFSLLPGDPTRIFTEPITTLIAEFGGLNDFSAQAALPFFLFSLFLLSMNLILFVTRYIIVSIFIAIFPITLFLYCFNITRDMGRSLMEHTLIWIFSQVIVAVVLVSIYGLFLIDPLQGGVLIISGLVASLMLIITLLGSVFTFKNFLPG